ncbi:Autophagyrelated protein 12, putative [Acanthamoeba castellanii str. Neff]|uniref:Ubiquitin-like protein ATG12 n=2 Tax=Acanthamoeba castellanii TaxID=5755 RepID=L8GUS5_ACACF|nr:Autophagyrelated protein 12, putative [Acanthamoeba castellanii str. Neff]XP_004338763.1 Autophagyrelated protein 12, putative [Acanthamoeba castellanii str. Neff]ADV31361.1 autophagy protein 12 [Acanthamoeba castellanii]ELR12941.1 Autophagyrelated protein 12, putative [Acanthamoeba castellanii str. Neff]ELR16750.1 Autophagyrelated protein 12, putative [Acanthamoeba castellanii str. Neff]
MADASAGGEQAAQPPVVASAPAAKPVEEYMKDGKVVIMFKAVGGASALKVNKFKLQAKASFQFIVDFLRKQLRCKPTDPLFLFVNGAFQPNPEEVIADLFKCFHNSGQLVINYCTTAAWG